MISLRRQLTRLLLIAHLSVVKIIISRVQIYHEDSHITRKLWLTNNNIDALHLEDKVHKVTSLT